MKSRNISRVALVAVAGATVALTGCQNGGSAAHGQESGGSAAPSTHAAATHGSAGSSQHGARPAHRTATEGTAAPQASDAAGSNTAPVSLVSVTKGQHRSATVRVPSGAQEAASWDAKGNIWFWSNAGGTWQRIGSSRYPMLPGGNGDSTKVASTLLPGMTHAAYIADGVFTGDSSGNTIAFAANRDGKWGTVAPKAGDDALVPTGKPATDNTTPGIWRDARFTGGMIETTVGNPFMANANASAYPLITDWSWRSGEFVEYSSNAFLSKVVDAPKPPANDPLHDCPTKLPDGTYFGGVSASQPTGDAPYSTVPVRFWDPNGGDFCSLRLGANTPVTTPATTSSGGTWVTVPAWMLQTTLTQGAGVTKVYPEQVKSGESPMVAPGLRSLRPDLGKANDDSIAAQVVVKDGKVAGIELVEHT